MAIYAVGDVNGNYDGLMHLLDSIGFDKNTDMLWCSGNLVGSYEGNLPVLQYIKNLERQAICVLGENELSLLSIAYGTEPAEPVEAYETFLALPESKEYLTWLSQWSLFHFDRKINYAMVHAGMPADWSLSQLSTFSVEAETALSTNHQAYFENTSKAPPRRWNAKLQGWKRLHFIVSAFTRTQKITAKGYMDFGLPLAPNPPMEEYLAWYEVPNRATKDLKIVFSEKQQRSVMMANIYPLSTGNFIKDLPGVIKLSSKQFA